MNTAANAKTLKPGRSQGNATASALAVLGAVVTTVSNFFIAWLVSRRGAEQAGIFFVATAIATIAGNGAGLGTQTGMVYFLPQALTGPDPSPGGLLRIAALPVVTLSVVVAGTLGVLAGPFSGLIAGGSDDLTSMIRVIALTVPAFALTTTFLGAARGMGTMTPTVVIGQVLRPGLQIVFLALTIIRREPDAWEIAAAWGAPIVLGLVASIVSLARLGGLRRGSTGAVDSSEFWTYTRPRSLSTALQMALERIDVILVSAFVGKEMAGVYGALSRYITAGNFLIFSLGQSVAPHLRRATSKANWTESGRLLQQATGWLVLAAWPYFLLVALNPEPLARLLDSDYATDARILTVLALGMMVSAAAGPIDLALLMLGRSRASLLAIVVAMTTDVLLVIALTPSFGIAGAAWAWAVSVAVQNGLASWLVHRSSPLRAWSRPAALAAVTAIVSVVPSSLLSRSLLGDGFASLVVSAFLSAILFIFALAALQLTVGIDRLLPAGIAGRLARSSRWARR